MRNRILDLIDFEKVNVLLEGFNKTTGFVTAILDLEGNVLSKSGWRQMCTDFHRINPETSKKCTISDTELANKMVEGEKYHFYQCLNGLVDVAVPIVIKGEHIANLFSGQFFFEEPDRSFFKKQADKYGFGAKKYFEALEKVPVVSQEKVLTAMNFLLNMTEMISDMTFQKLEQMELNKAIQKNERILRLFVEHSPASIAMFDNQMCYLVASNRFFTDYNLGNLNIIGRSHYEVFPEISERWKEFHRRGLAGETMKESNDPFPRADGKTDWVRWEIRPWYESESQIGGIILFSEVITAQVEDREALRDSDKYNRMLFEQSAIGLVLTTMDGKLVDINSTFATIIGRSIKDTSQLTYWEITPEKYLDQEQQQLKNLDETGFYGPYEKEYIHKDGHFVPVRLQGKIIERAGIKYIWSSVEDISEQKRADEKIRINELRLKKGQEIGHFGYWQQDIGSDSIWASAEAMKIYGLQSVAGELPRNTIAACIRDIELVRQAATDLIVNNRNYNIEFAIDPADGSPSKIISAVAELERDNDGVPVRIMGVLQDITERTQAEEKIKENYSLLRIAGEKAKLGGWNVNLEENRSYWSDEVAAIHEMPAGYSPLVKDGINFYAPEWRDKITEVFTRCAQEGISYDEEMEIITSTEKRVWVRTIGEAVRDDKGKIVKVQGAFQDITERKHSEEELLKSQERFDLAMKASTDGLFDWNLETNEIYYAPAWKKMLGYEDHEMANDFSVWEKTTEPEDVKKSWEMQQKLISKQIDRFVLEFKMKHKDGHWVDILSRAGAIFNDSGKAIRIVGTHTDITERKRAEEKLEKQNEYVKMILDNFPIGIATNEIDSMKVTYMNRKFSEIYGWPEDEFPYVGDFFEKVFPDMEYRQQMQTRILADLSSGDIERMDWDDLKITTKAEDQRIVHASNIPLINQNIMVSIVQDITERKHAEEKIKKQLDELRRRYDVTLDREGRVMELKQEVNELLKQSGEPLRYESAILDDQDTTIIS